MNGERLDRFFWPSFCGLASLSLALLWSNKYLPMVDLPQHAAQLRLFFLHSDPAFPFAADYQLQLLNPYLACYALGLLFSTVLPIAVAIKVVVTIAVLGLPVAMIALLRGVGGDRFWSLLGFPLAFSFPFYWGLLNFILAVPLALILIARAFDDRSGWRHGLALAALGIVVFLTHGMVCAFALLVAGTVIVLRRPWRAWPAALAPLAAPALLGLMWIQLSQKASGQFFRGPTFNLTPRRLVALPGTLVGDAVDPQTALFGGALVVLFLAALWRSARSQGPSERSRGVPAVLALAFFLLGPEIYTHMAFFNARFSVFIVPLLVIALPRANKSLRVAIVVLALAWLVLLWPRFHSFDLEARQVDRLIAALPEQQQILGLAFDPFPSRIFVPALIHHHAWYQVEKGGRVDFSFSYFFVSLVRYRLPAEAVPDFTILMPESFAQADAKFWERFDAVITRGNSERVIPERFQSTLTSGAFTLFQALIPPPRPKEEAP